MICWALLWPTPFRIGCKGGKRGKGGGQGLAKQGWPRGCIVLPRQPPREIAPMLLLHKCYGLWVGLPCSGGPLLTYGTLPRRACNAGKFSRMPGVGLVAHEL